ncbi:MAG: manganese efflux pump [Xenococcus sp. MO_188.B8]|nr:manganese efflux pump [Xenococcus sp. MO_188.B8]
MGAIAIFAFLVGLDNLQVASAIGLMPIRSSRKWAIAISFGLCEAIMPLVGLMGGHLLHQSFNEIAQIFGPLILFTCGLLIMYLAWKEQDVTEVANSNWTFWGLPLSLSMDNLFAGVGLGSMGYPILFSALVIGLVSGSMSLGGMFLGRWFRRRITWNVDLLSGAYLVFISGFFLLVDFD